jgi:FdrA protein
MDFGDDEFTAARPRPIIDPSLRISRLLEEAKDPSVGVIMMDIIVGYGVADRTIEQHAKAIREAISVAGLENRTLLIINETFLAHSS